MTKIDRLISKYKKAEVMCMKVNEISRQERNLHAQLRRIRKRMSALEPTVEVYSRLNEKATDIVFKLADLNKLLPEGIRERRYRAGLKKFHEHMRD